MEFVGELSRSNDCFPMSYWKDHVYIKKGFSVDIWSNIGVIIFLRIDLESQTWFRDNDVQS